MSVPDPAHRVRSAFARAARSYDTASRVYDEIGRRLLSHLDPIAIDPARILDVGCGTGTGAALLASRYRRARVCAVDYAWPMLEVAKTKTPRFFSRQRFVCAAAERLPVDDRCVDLVHANLLLPWCPVLSLPLKEFARVLVPGGLLLLSSLGPDTLKEVRGLWAGREEAEGELGLLDMHELGDALVAAGLVGAVMETERLTVRYRSMEQVIEDLERSGAWAARSRRPSAGGAREDFARRRQRYLRMRAAAPVDISVEVVHAHAWAPVPRSGQSAVEVAIPGPGDPRRLRSKGRQRKL